MEWAATWTELTVDVLQSAAMIFITITQVVMLRLMRNEMRRASSAVSVMSRAMGESGELAHRIEQLEEDVAELAMHAERQRGKA